MIVDGKFVTDRHQVGSAEQVPGVLDAHRQSTSTAEIDKVAPYRAGADLVVRNELSGSGETKTREAEERSYARTSPSPKDERARISRSNRRIGWTLLAPPAVFVAGIIYSRVTDDSRMGLMVLSAAIFLFLVVAIGRNLLK